MITIVQTGFIPITIACYLQLSHPLTSTIGEQIGNLIGTCTFIMTFVLYPLFMIGIAFCDKKTLEDPEMTLRFGTIYKGHKINTFGQRAFRLVFQGRRLAVLYFSFMWFDRPIF
jgi:hypothetical protein